MTPTRFCAGCEKNVTPIRLYEKKDGKEWLIYRCPKERCAFNIDIEAYVRPTISEANKDDKRRFLWRDIF